jgi:hypothetical protein
LQEQNKNNILPRDRAPAGARPLKTTRYFEEQVLRKRPYIRTEWCAQVLAAPLRREHQPDGRIRVWGNIEGLGAPRVLGVITLEDGETVHNAPSPDRSFPQADAP